MEEFFKVQAEINKRTFSLCTIQTNYEFCFRMSKFNLYNINLILCCFFFLMRVQALYRQY